VSGGKGVRGGKPPKGKENVRKVKVRKRKLLGKEQDLLARDEKRDADRTSAGKNNQIRDKYDGAWTFGRKERKGDKKGGERESTAALLVRRKEEGGGPQTDGEESGKQGYFLRTGLPIRPEISVLDREGIGVVKN